jgi:FtsZ-interacting cell division protein YlmF
MNHYEEQDLEQERAGWWNRIRDRFFPAEELEEEEEGIVINPAPRVHRLHPYHITIRKEIHNLEDARLVADGLKEGRQQILNLASTPPGTRERIVDFLYGVVYTIEGNVERIGEHVFLYAPPQAILDTPQPTIRLKSEELPG